jgi:hypothetical protein
MMIDQPHSIGRDELPLWVRGQSIAVSKGAESAPCLIVFPSDPAGLGAAGLSVTQAGAGSGWVVSSVMRVFNMDSSSFRVRECSGRISTNIGRVAFFREASHCKLRRSPFTDLHAAVHVQHLAGYMANFDQIKIAASAISSGRKSRPSAKGSSANLSGYL